MFSRYKIPDKTFEILIISIFETLMKAKLELSNCYDFLSVIFGKGFASQNNLRSNIGHLSGIQVVCG
jgi:hypothetical protein